MEFPHLVLARFYEHIEPIDRSESYEEVYADLDFEPVLQRLSVGQNARVVRRHAKHNLQPREVRMPRQ